MPRIRSLKPDFMEDGKVKALSRDARLFFVQMLTEVDDKGRFKYTPKRLAGVLYPGDDDVTGKDIEAWMLECEAQGMIVRYTVGDNDYGWLRNFNKHQVISKPSKSRWPSYEESQEVSDQGPFVVSEIPIDTPGDSRSSNGVAQESPGTDLGSGSRKEDLGKGKDEAHPSTDLVQTRIESTSAPFLPSDIPGVTRDVLNDVRDDDGRPLASHEKSSLRNAVKEWLGVGHHPDDLKQAIAASPFKTPAAVGGELRRHKQPSTRSSPGDDSLAAANRYLNRHEGAT
jgi:hypothetical protein